jgi:hypothetical protein
MLSRKKGGALCMALCLASTVGASLNVSATQRRRQAPRQSVKKTIRLDSLAPKEVLGFTPGDDRKLASWEQISNYFERLGRASSRMVVQNLGKTTLGRPFLLAIISSPSNLARLDRIKEIQRKLADPRLLNGDDRAADRLIAEGKTIVLITCGIHSTEVGGNLVSMNIAYKLASDDSEGTREILNNCVILLVPSLNPDGVDIVKEWYDKTLGTPSEGTGPPDLYHHYTGHDNNRDWYAFTQVETQLTVDKVHNVWHPQIVHDIHQQGETGSRFFLPPYVDPWEPNVPARIQAGVNFMGTTMAWELAAEGKAGVVIDGVYDAWSPSRAYQHYHGGIRILSETASARLASPTVVPFEKLTNQVGVNTRVRSWNFPLIWPGGEWRLANIVDYMQSGAFALMRNAARYRDHWLRNFYLVGKDAVKESGEDRPFAFLLPPSQYVVGNAERSSHSRRTLIWQDYGLARLESILVRGGVEVLAAKSEFEADGVKYPAGTAIVLMAQPYGAFAKAMLEGQHYPDLREYPGGPPQRPYDVTANTLPLLMGVRAIAVRKPIELPETDRLGKVDPPDSPTPALGSARLGIYKNHLPAMDEGWMRWIFDQLQIKYASIEDSDLRAGGLRSRFDCIIIPDQPPGQIAEGLPATRYPAEIAGGMGAEGVESLKKFVEESGTLITLNDASRFAIERLGLPVKDVLKGASARDFYCPGSILGIEFDPNDVLARSVPPLETGVSGGGNRPSSGIAWFESGPALEPTSDKARIVARFADAKDLLLSGWLLGAPKLAHTGAIVEARKGRGRVVMFAFRPQYRGQSWSTVPFLLNAIETSAPAQ